MYSCNDIDVHEVFSTLRSVRHKEKETRQSNKLFAIIKFKQTFDDDISVKIHHLPTPPSLCLEGEVTRPTGFQSPCVLEESDTARADSEHGCSEVSFSLAICFMIYIVSFTIFCTIFCV